MQKIARFSILCLLYVGFFIVGYAIIPSIVWLFGGNFRDVSMHPFYATIFTICWSVFLGIVFYESFDENFYSKNK